MVEDPAGQRMFDTLQERLKTILPDRYQDTGENIQPVSMGSAGLKFAPDGTVAWNEMWGSFCHLAMAGGPPHKGSLLEPASQAEVNENSGRYRQVVVEICRGINMVTGLDAERADVDGWVRVVCSGHGMAGWLTRAIVMENVSVCCEGAVLYLPAAPGYRLEKEIKNVVTVIAKTFHYWSEHMRPARQQTISDLFAEMQLKFPLIQPAQVGFGFQFEQHQLLCRKMTAAFHHSAGLETTTRNSNGWLGVECQSVSAAIRAIRLMMASNVLSRREDTVVFVPVNPIVDPDGEIVVQILARIYPFAATGHDQI